ncbi:type III pantothenate kinase [Porticoccus sp. W117]|uniref:type III pantothenate kinase n=1 Tax=Porticoccus sp. W117 TaxID=3054777 RepID=UPI0025934CA0|nr:type III pantothenate kinase [Porticoccus sp. W117]MDM3870582.1 type III pantothenate kinase [Porticoccus sp. W117]
MTAILDIDIGNTRTKWRCGEQRGVVARDESWGAGLAALKVCPGRVRVANVAGPDIEANLARWVSDNWGLPLELAVTSHSAAGVGCGYPDPTQLGIDRWLAILAASLRVSGGVVVVSAGSAVTVDILTDAGNHLGGYIVPGLEMQRRALYAGTSQVKVAGQWQGARRMPGSSTVDAVLNGCLAMVVELVSCARKELSDKAPVLLSGGDAEYLLPHLGGEVEWVPELVLDGLAVLMP